MDYEGTLPVYNSLLLDPNLSQMNPMHICTPNLFNISFNVVLPSMPMSPKCSLPFTFLDQKYLNMTLAPEHPISFVFSGSPRYFRRTMAVQVSRLKPEVQEIYQ
jgi:hypothetical protein